ncbi:MAG TPA: dihydrofolate reductase [Casimicrobiaceae bacterium]|nr:dihydrofolate reductase [Casimicrobiaceae bacterium]
MALPSDPRGAAAAEAARESRLALILAVAANGTIGADGALPWQLPDDLKRFKSLTLGHSLIMGRKTYASIGRALPGRENIVVTRDRRFDAPGIVVAHSITEALARVTMPLPAFCIGGAEIAQAALPHADTMHLTEIEREFAGDVHMPSFDRAQWRQVTRERHRSPDGFDYAYVTYVR